MAKNRVGIEVQVEFPTIKELQDQVSKKYDDKIKLMLKTDVSKESISDLKLKIQNALDNGKKFKFDLNLTNVNKSLNSIKGKVEKIDKLMGKKRTFNIDFNVKDMNKTMSQILKNQQNVDKELVKQAKKTSAERVQAHKEEVNRIIAQTKNLARLTETTYANGDKRTKISEDLGSGYSLSTTVNRDGTSDVTEDINETKRLKELEQQRKTALKEIEEQMKRMHKLTMDIKGATGQHKAELLEQRSIEAQITRDLMEQYESKHKVKAIDEESVQELIRRQKLVAKATQASKEEAESKKDTASAISKMVQIESKIQQLKKQAVTATKEERDAIREQVQYYNKITAKLNENNQLLDAMTAQQKEEFENIKRIGVLETQRAKAKQKTNEEERRQKAILSEVISALREAHSIELKINEIKARELANGNALTNEERTRLEVLKQQLAFAKQKYAESQKNEQGEERLTAEMREQLDAMERINQQELQRSSQVARTAGQQDKITNQLNRHAQLQREIAQLQRDLVFAGVREEGVIEARIRHYRDQQKAIEQSLRAENQMTEALERQVRETQRLANEQMELNRLRREARDRDRVSGDASGYGLIDPYSIYANASQMAYSIIEPMERLDEALTGIQKVAEGTEEQFRELAGTAYDVGSSLGVRADEYLLAVENWVTAGRELAEAQDLAKTSMVGSFVGNITPDAMVKYMSVPMTAFAKQGLKANDIINTMNETANNHAVEMEQLGKAYMRSATTAKSAGISFQYLTGMITGAEEQTKKGGERIGTGIKTISANITQIQSKFSKDNQKKNAYLTDVIGIDMTTAQTAKDILEELAGKWENLSKEQKTNASTMLAGKEHMETLQAIIEQWDRVKEVAGEADDQMGLGKDGSAYIEHAKQSDSLKFKLAELRNAWDKLMVTLGTNGGAGAVLVALTEGLEELTELANNKDLIKGMQFIFGAIAIHGATNAFRRFFDFMNTGLKGYQRNLLDVVRSTRALRGANDSVANATPPVVGGGTNRVRGTVNRTTTRRRTVNRDAVNRVRERNATERANRQAETNAVNSSRNAGRAIKALGKGLLGFIPIVGDALLLASMLGVDVFGMFSKTKEKIIETTETAKEFAENLDQQTKKTIATNKILNGSVNKQAETYKKLVEAREFALNGNHDESKGKIVDGDGIMTSDEFATFRKDFNKFTKDNDFDIKITMNDPDHIQKQLDKLNKVLAEISAKEVIKLSDKFEDTAKKGEKAEKDKAKAEKAVQVWKDERDRHNAQIAMIKEKMDKGKALSDEETRIYLKREEESKKIQAEIKKQEEAIKGYDVKIGAVTKATEDLAKKTVDAVKKGADVSEVSSETSLKMIPLIVDWHNKLIDKINLAKQAQEQLNTETSMSADSWKMIQKEFSNLTITVGDTQKRIGDLLLSEVDGHNDVENAIRDAILAEQEKLQTQANNQASTIQMLDEQTGYYYEIDDVTGRIVEKTSLINRNLREMPPLTEVKIKVTGDAETDAYIDKVMTAYNLKPKTIQVDFKGNYTNLFPAPQSTPAQSVVRKPPKLQSVSANSVSVGKTGISSNNVSSTSLGGNLIKTPTTVGSIDNATSANDSPPASVNSDIWRYWGREMSNEDITQEINKLTSAIQNATDNEQELVRLYKEQNNVLRNSESGLNALAGLKQSEMNEVLGSLRGYGFGVNGNDITNLGLAKSFSGDSATKVEELLNKWRQLGTDLTGISQSIADLNERIKENTEAIEKAEIQKELESFGGIIKRLTSVITMVDNKSSITGTRLGFVDDGDFELGLVENERALNSAKKNVNDLMWEFNQLSQSTINYKENGEALESHLQSLGSKILEQADAIIAYQQALNELEISRVAEDMEKFNDAVERNQGKISNNIENLQEGLLSGTDFSDLNSSTSDGLNLGRDNAWSKLAQERISLEEEVQQALDGFAKKNIDRVAGIANETLDIYSNMYNQMFAMQNNYSNGVGATFDPINGDLISLGVTDDSDKLATELESYFGKIQAKQDELTSQYNEDMAKALSPDEKNSLTDKYIVDSLKIQEEYLNASIKANQDAIRELNSQLTDSSLTDAQKEEIANQIESYEDAITDAQNRIKDTIQQRFDFEFSLLDEAVSKYDKYSSELEYAQGILDAIGGENYASHGVVLEQMMSVEKARNSELANSLKSLQEQQSLYEEGSFEWNLINEQVEKYQQMLRDSNIELIEMNKNIMSNSFDGTVTDMEKAMFGGKTIEQFERMQELWLTGVEREIALEDTYQRLADLGTKIHDEKMAQLAKQEKLSRFEMDYLNKQLDVLELQQKLENLNKERTIQTLKQNADGTWDWQYEADAEQISQVRDDLAQKELELKQAEEQARKDYLSQLEEILSDAEEGDFENIEEFQGAIDDLSSAFDTIVGEFPQIKEEYLKELVDAYSKYITENGDILSGVDTPVNQQVYEGFSNEIAKAFNDISKDIGESIANALIAKLPSIGIPVEKPVEDKSISITLEKLEFPNVTSADGLKDAILSLPQIALQKSKEK